MPENDAMSAAKPHPTSSTATELAFQRCIRPECGSTFGIDEVLMACPRCGSLLDVNYDWGRTSLPSTLQAFTNRGRTSSAGLTGPADFSGVWRFRELLPFARLSDIVTVGEGRTLLQQADGLARELGMRCGRLFLQYEGANPSGSFKDNGMTAAFTLARRIGRRRVACASTGNTSASMALYAAASGDHDAQPMQAIVLVGRGKIALGKLAQALDHGALTFQIDGDFDACLRCLFEIADRLDLYLMNSVNPFRLEGQKTIVYRVLEGLGWEVPDWIIVPAGNLGNTSAFGKALAELHALGLIDRLPRIAAINAAGANTLFELYEARGLRWNGGRYEQRVVNDYYAGLTASGRRAETVASAIEIAHPVNLPKALRTLEVTRGVVRQVDDREILDHKALVGRRGLGCEPAGAASVAGLRRLLAEQVIAPDERVVCILTGHGLKDPDATVQYHSGLAAAGSPAFANQPIRVPNDVDAICAAIESM
jgi:threonine synthase